MDATEVRRLAHARGRSDVASTDTKVVRGTGVNSLSRELPPELFRLEAVRAGFRRAWQAKDHATIVEVARKIPDDVLHEDAKLLMWYDQALVRRGIQS